RTRAMAMVMANVAPRVSANSMAVHAVFLAMVWLMLGLETGWGAIECETGPNLGNLPLLLRRNLKAIVKRLESVAIIRGHFFEHHTAPADIQLVIGNEEF